MCAQFGTIEDQELLAAFYSVDEPPIPTDIFSRRYLPHQMAPVLTEGKRGLKLTPMSFSLIPSWSKTRRVKFATHNARLETIAEKPTWKRPFATRRCLVPMNYFVEPIYEGEHAGHMIRFTKSDEGLMTAAGIWDQWADNESGEVVESFSIITDEPPPLVEEMGHDRCPVFLKEEAFKGWVRAEKADPDELKELLNQHRDSIEFGVTRDRPMKPGWEKRK